VLEHFTQKHGKALVSECYRVLDTGGTIRIVVPDLEQIVMAYLDSLTRACAEEQGWNHNHDWMMVELVGMLVWEESVPQMFQYLRQREPPNLPFVASRISADVMNLACGDTSGSFGTAAGGPGRSILRRLKNRVLWAILGLEDLDALNIGLARTEGHVHKWMYDRYSLPLLLRELGFTDVQQVDARTSRIPGWSSFCLDLNRDGTEHQKSSLYVEGTKPSRWL